MSSFLALVIAAAILSSCEESNAQVSDSAACTCSPGAPLAADFEVAATEPRPAVRAFVVLVLLMTFGMLMLRARIRGA